MPRTIDVKLPPEPVASDDNAPLFDATDAPVVALVLLHALIGNAKGNATLHQDDTQHLLINVALNMADKFIEACADADL